MSDFDLNKMRAMHYMRAAQHVQEQKRAAVMHPQMQAELNDWLNELDEVKCQSRHDHPENNSCSVEVTHMAITCGRPSGYMVCASAVTYGEVCFAAGYRCAGCLAPARDCWEIRTV